MGNMDKDVVFGRVGFENLCIKTIIGTYADERINEQELYVDLHVELDFSDCALSDHIEDTCDYVQLAALCTELAQTKKYKLVEAFAYEVVEVLLEKPKIRSVRIKVKKPKALSQAQCAVVELSRTKASGLS